MFEELKLRKFNDDPIEYLSSLKPHQVKKSFKKLIDKNLISSSEQIIFLNQFNNDELLLSEPKIREMLSKLDITEIIAKLDELSDCEFITYIHNMPKDKLIELIKTEPNYINYYRGNDEAVFQAINSSTRKLYINHFKHNGKDINEHLLNNKNVIMHLIKYEPHEILNYQGDDKDINDLIMKIIEENNEYICYYKGDNPQIIELIVKIIKSNPQHIENYWWNNTTVINTIIELIKKDLDLFKYYTGLDERVYKEVLNLGFIPSYENLKENNVIDCQSTILLKEALKIDIRSLEFFDCYNIDEMYNIIINLINQDYNNIQYISNMCLNSIFAYEPDKKTLDLILENLSKNPDSIKLLKRSNKTLFKYLNQSEDKRFEKLIIQEVQKDVMYLEHFIDQIGIFDYNKKIISLLQSKVNDPKFKQLAPEILKNNRLDYLSPLFLHKIIIPAIDNDITLIQYVNFEYVQDNVTKEIYKIFFKHLKTDLSLFKYYKGNDERIEIFYLENGGKIDEEIIASMNINEERLSLKKDDIINIINKYNTNSSEEIFNLFRYIVRNNDEFFKTFELSLLEEQYLTIFRNPYTNKINANLLRVLGRYKEISTQIKNILINKDEKFINVLREIFHTFAHNEYDYGYVISSLLNSLETDKIKIFNIVAESFATIEDKKRVIENLIYILSTNNIVPINSIEDVINYEQLQDEKCSNIITNNEEYTLSEVKEAIFLEKFGIDLKTAIDLQQKYGSDLDVKDIELNEKDKQLITILEAINTILNCDDKKRLIISYFHTNNKVSINLSESYKLDAEIRKMYARALNSKLLQVKNLKSAGLEEYYDIPMYFAFDENNPQPFNILLTCLGAYTDYKKPKNYKTDWLRPKEMFHGFCTSLISNEMMGTAQMNYACLAFTDIPEENLLLQAPFDIASRGAVQTISPITNLSNDRLQFLFPKQMINSTRHTHNEIVIERLLKEGKIKPSYVIFMTENFSLTKLMTEKATFKKIDKSSEISRWENALQAAKDFGIPIVIVDRGKVKKYEASEREKLFQEFAKAKEESTKSLYNLLIRIQNNRAGCRAYWNESGVTKNDINELINRIFIVLNRYYSNGEYDFVIESCDTLTEWLNVETGKKGRKLVTVGNTELGINIEELQDKITNLKDKAISEKKEDGYDIKDIVTIIKEKYQIDISSFEKQFELMNNENFNIESKDILELVDEKQLTPDEVEARYYILKAIIDLNIIDVHQVFKNINSSSLRICENMILLTALLATNNHNLRNINLNVLLEISKYYEISDNNKAALLAFKTLKGKYSNEELSLIYTIIYCKGNSELLEETYKKAYININNNKSPNENISISEEVTIKYPILEIFKTLEDASNLEKAKNIKDNSLDINKLSKNAKKFIDFAYRLSELQIVSCLSQLSSDNMLDDRVAEYIVEHFEKNKKTISPKELLSFLLENNLITNISQERIIENEIKL